MDKTEQLSERIDSLELLYQQVNQQVFHNQTLTWYIIIGVFAIIGVALYFIASNAVKKGVENGIKEVLKQDKEKADVKNPLFLESIKLARKEDDSKNVRLVKYDNEPIINIETDKADAILKINQKEIPMGKTYKYELKPVNGNNGKIVAYLSDLGIVNILINEVGGGICYGHWGPLCEMNFELMPIDLIIIDISNDYQIKVDGGFVFIRNKKIKEDECVSVPIFSYSFIYIKQ
nr:hypothetical protein [uncultured Aminipila sp.]